MDADKCYYVAALPIAAASFIAALAMFEGIMAVLSALTFFFAVSLLVRGSRGFGIFALSASVAALAATVLSVTVLSPELFEDSAGNHGTAWFLLVGTAHAVPAVLLTVLAFASFASFWDASHNWAAVRGFGPFLAMGFEVPGFVSEYAFSSADPWMADNGYILFHFLAAAVLSAVCFWALSRAMRSRDLVIRSGGWVQWRRRKTGKKGGRRGRWRSSARRRWQSSRHLPRWRSRPEWLRDIRPCIWRRPASRGRWFP